jgi:alpha-L-arabinofuranosidase
MSARNLFPALLCCAIGTAVLYSTAPRAADSLRITIDARQASEPVTQYEYGMFIEPIGGLIARSLWAEMLDDRKFFYSVVSEGKDSPVSQSVEGRRGIMYRKWRPVGGDDAVVTDTQSSSAARPA